MTLCSTIQNFLARYLPSWPFIFPPIFPLIFYSPPFLILHHSTVYLCLLISFTSLTFHHFTSSIIIQCYFASVSIKLASLLLGVIVILNCSHLLLLTKIYIHTIISSFFCVCLLLLFAFVYFV